MNETLILEGARTPFCAWAGGTRADGEKGGALKPHDPIALGTIALKGALGRSGLKPQDVGATIFGNTYAVGAHALYGGRYVAHHAGVPPEAPGWVVTMACASGLKSFIDAADVVQKGQANVAAAVGADNCSLVPRAVFIPSFQDLMCNTHIAKTAQTMSKERGFSREDQDRVAMQSHARAAAARARGVFKDEIVPAGAVEADDCIVEQAAAQRFLESKKLFEEGDATAANTHAVVDGGSAILVANAEGAKAGARPLGRLLGSAVVGVAGERMAYATVAAVHKLLGSLNRPMSDFDLFEVNETFASQLLVALRELGLSEDRVNVNGGALALGHPFGGTGPRLVHTLLKELKRRKLKRGIAAICAGGGSGIAVAVETV